MDNEPDVAELLRLKRGDRSYAEVSRGCGGVPSPQRLQQLSDLGPDMKAFLEPPAITGLAHGLRVTEAAIIRACTVSLIRAGRLGTGAVAGSLPRLAQLLPAGAGSLTEQQQAVVLAVVDSLVAANEVAPPKVKARR